MLDSPVIGVGDTFVTSLNRIIREANSAASGRRFPNSTPIINDVRGGTPRKRSCRRTGRFDLSDDEDNEGLPDLSYGLTDNYKTTLRTTLLIPFVIPFGIHF